MPLSTLLALLIFTGTYFVVALGRMPGFRVDRTGAALIGASLMVSCDILTLDEAKAAIDFDTLLLLLGMMIVVAYLRLSGFFGLVNAWAIRHTRGPRLLLGAVILVSGVLSAFLLNDTICIVLTPLVVQLVSRLGRNPVPYLLALAAASNIGSTATITGNPQNIIIGSLSHIPYGRFAAALSPVAALGLVVLMLLVLIYYRDEFRGETIEATTRMPRYNGPLLLKSVAVTICMVVLFFMGQPVAKVAIGAGGLLLLTRRAKPEKVYRQIDFSLLVMFAGLFVVVAGLEKTLLTPEHVALAGRIHLERMPVLCAASAILSNLVSNVPAVLVLKPFVLAMGSQVEKAWLMLAMSSTLAGNLTIVGSVANLIVVQQAHRAGVEIGFREHFRLGLPLTILTLLIGLLLLR